MQNRHVEEIVSEPAQQERLLKSVKYQQPEEYKEIAWKILNIFIEIFRASLADKHALTSYDFQFSQAHVIRCGRVSAGALAEIL